jgi:DNA-binding NarL/FixJ family response regulator
VIVRDPQLRALATGVLAESRRIRVVDELEDAEVVLWEPPADEPDELPLLPSATAPVVALVPEGRDPLPLLAVGARGVVTHADRTALDPAQLQAALTAAASGLTVLDEDAADSVVASWSPQDRGRDRDRGIAPESGHQELTVREREVLELVAEGLSNRAIGARLDISAHTVKFHVDSLLDKLGARSRTQAVVVAFRRGVLALV